jgi:hypothetical protein
VLGAPRALTQTLWLVPLPDDELLPASAPLLLLLLMLLEEGVEMLLLTLEAVGLLLVPEPVAVLRLMSGAGVMP